MRPCAQIVATMMVVLGVGLLRAGELPGAVSVMMGMLLLLDLAGAFKPVRVPVAQRVRRRRAGAPTAQPWRHGRR